MHTIVDHLSIQSWIFKCCDSQKNNKNNFHVSLEAIKSGTQNFSDHNCIGEGRFWRLYEGEASHPVGCTAIYAKRWDNKSHQAHIQFLTELESLLKYKHENIIGLVGYCNEMNENIIVYEHASNGRLDKHLDNASLTWMKRLKISIDVANGLEFLHKGGVEEESLRHKDIKSGSILLDSDWNAKISNLELSSKGMAFDREKYVEGNAWGSLGYIDPEYLSRGMFIRPSDIYSLGVVLCEILCGRLAWVEGCEDHSQSLGPISVKHYNEKGDLHEMIFEGIKEQIVPQSLTTFQAIAIQCLHDNTFDRPWTGDVVIQLKKALEFQEDYEIWEPKLPIDYKELIQMSKTPELYNSIEMKRDLYNMFFKGILHQDGKVWFSLGANGERNEMISARKFTYKNGISHKWRFVQESRFEKTAKMFDITKMNILIRITTQFLSPGVNYGAYIIFRFCDTKVSSSKPMYVNLKYKIGDENLHAYFATWRDDKWMMIELWRFSCHKKDTDFEVLLESLSQYYCGSGAIYVEGIEFRVIENVNDKEIEVQQILTPNSNKDQLSLLNEVNKKKCLMLSAKEVLYDSSNVKRFHLKPSTESRFQEVIEVLPQQVLRINCKTNIQMLSPNTEYLCYLVFKLSEKCSGLHCPVKVRDLFHRKKKEATILYFRPPSPWNVHGTNSVPRQREDGWMEVKVWKFNSNHQLKNDYIPMNLKLITYEGTMSGLVVCGLEFRSM